MLRAFLSSVTAYDRDELQQVLHPQHGTSRRDGDKRVRISQVRQSPLNGPRPAILAPEVEPVLAPVPARMDYLMYLAVTWMKWMADPELLLAILCERCS